MRSWRLPAEVDTDQLVPGTAMKFGLDEMARHCLQTLRPGFTAGVRPGDVLVAGRDFGIGSSREQAASVLVHLGVAAVVAPSFAGLYFRNAFNVGLLLLTCDQAERIADGSAIRFDARQGFIDTEDGQRLRCEPIPGFLLDRVEAGGLVAELQTRFKRHPPPAQMPP